MNLETKITIYKFTPQVFTLTLYFIMFDKFFPASSRPLLTSANLEFNSPIVAVYISLLISPKPNLTLTALI